MILVYLELQEILKIQVMESFLKFTFLLKI